MKIKNLKFMLLGLLAMGSMNAFAADPVYKLSDGIRYVEDKQAGEEGTEAKPWSAKVYGATTAATTLSIPATFNVSDGNGATAYYKVSGFESGWATADDVTTAGKQRKKISGTLASLTIDATNMGNLANAFTGLEKLTTVKVTNGSWTDEGYVTGRLDEADLEGQIESLDLSGLEKVTATVSDLKGAKWAKLTAVKLPSKLETLGANFFEGSKITTIELPATLKTIGNYAFKESKLTALNLNNCAALVSIGKAAFKTCEDLASLVMGGLKDGDKFTTIDDAAFAFTAIKAANIPASVTTLGSGAFEGCKSLTQLSAMAGLTEIPYAAFRDCEKLPSVSINANITKINQEAFKGCKALATVAFKADPEAPVLTEIGNSAFEGCEALTALDLTATAITTVKGNTGNLFAGCTALAEVKLPGTVTEIEPEVFGDCVIEDLDLSETQITTLKAIFRRPGGVWATADKKYSSLKSIILPETCTSIYKYPSEKGVFMYCDNLTEITIPTAFETYTSDGAVPAYAFYYCTALETVNYTPTKVAAKQVFDMKAFLGCTPFVNIVTNSYYWNTYSVPTNATYGSTTVKVKTVADKGKSGKFFAKYCPITNVQINPDDAKVYGVYVDQGKAYFQALIKRGGVYQIEAGDHVIIKTDEEKEVAVKPLTATPNRSVTVDDIFTVATDTPTSDVQNETAGAIYGPSKVTPNNKVKFVAGRDYVYRLTNIEDKGGFGFTFFSGATMKAGQFFIISDINPNAGGRLEEVWLDENGNVEGDATAINKIQSKTEDGAIYNLQGVRVNAAKKGLYIQNGKKYIVK